MPMFGQVACKRHSNISMFKHGHSNLGCQCLNAISLFKHWHTSIGSLYIGADFRWLLNANRLPNLTEVSLFQLVEVPTNRYDYTHPRKLLNCLYLFYFISMLFCIYALFHLAIWYRYENASFKLKQPSAKIQLIAPLETWWDVRLKEM